MPVIRSSQYTAVGSSSAKFAVPMASGQRYRFCANTNAWVSVGATGGSASAGANSHYVAAGQELYLSASVGDATTNNFVHVIRDTADGKASLSLVEG